MNEIDVLFYVKKFGEAREKLVNTIAEAIIDEESFWKYYPVLHDVLPVGKWYDECPINLQGTLNMTENRGSVRYFDELLESLEDDREASTDELTRWFGLGKALEMQEVLSKHSTWDLMQQVIDYTLKHYICGTTFDW